jgi:hypothetical protein
MVWFRLLTKTTRDASLPTIQKSPGSKNLWTPQLTVVVFHLENDARCMMDSDEREVFFFLRSQSDQSFSAGSICRHAGGKRRFRDAPDWARPVILRMVERGILEVDATGNYRLKPLPKARSAAKRWVSPHIAAILKESGRKFGDGLEPDDGEAEAYYNSL